MFALPITEAAQSGNLIQTTWFLFDHEVVVLYDSGATHSFVSNECVRRLGLVMRELACELIVVTLAYERYPPCLFVWDALWRWQATRAR